VWGGGVTAYHKCISEEIQIRLLAWDICRHLVEIFFCLCVCYLENVNIKMYKILVLTLV
jgi:hypothetical protein